MYLLKNKIELFFILEELYELYDAGVAVAVVEGLHLAEDPGAGVSRNLIDDLHGKLHLRVDVHTSLHRGIGPFTQHLAGQLIQL